MFLKKHGCMYHETDHFEGIMPTGGCHLHDPDPERILRRPTQRGGQTYPAFHFKATHLDKIQAHCALLHPLPRAMKSMCALTKIPARHYWRRGALRDVDTNQALIAYIFKVDQDILYEFS